MTEMKSCKDFCDCLSDYLDGQMDEDCCRLIEEHLDRCSPCALMYESLKTTVLVCGKGLTAQIPDDVRESLRNFLRTHCRKENV